MTIKQPFLAGLALLVTLTAAPLLTVAGEWAPKGDVEFIVGAGSATGTDRTVRFIRSILLDEGLVDAPISVLNKPGAGNSIAFSYLAQHEGNAQYLMISSYNLISNNITGQSKLNLNDFTPIALLYNAYVSFAVQSDSPIKSFKQLAESLKKDPRSVTIATSTAVGTANHIALALALQPAGIDVRKLKVVFYKSGGKAVAALLGGHVDAVVSSSSTLARFSKKGGIRIIGNTSPKRLGGELADVPTLTEQGYPVDVSKWRLLFAPKGLTAAQIAYWDKVFGAMVKTDKWRDFLKKSFAGDESQYLNSAQTKEFLEKQQVVFKKVLTDLGLAK